MEYAELKAEAAKLLRMAAIYAEDGAIETAIERTRHAERLLIHARVEKADLVQHALNTNRLTQPKLDGARSRGRR